MNVAAYAALYKGANVATQGLTGSQDLTGDAFSRIFNSALNGSRSSNSIQDMLDKLQQRFPKVNVKEGEAEAGVEGAKKRYESEDPSSDQVAVSSSVLAGMLGSSSLAKMVEEAISGFLDRGSDSNLMNFQGAVVQRTVTITYTQVRYGEFHRSDETGELLGASELKANFHEQLADLIKKFFGDSKSAVSGAENTEADGEEEGKETDAASGTEKTPSTLPSFPGGSVSMWSLEVYYSFSYFSTSQFDTSGLGNSAGSGQASWQSQSWQYSSFSASLRGVLGGQIPSAIQSGGNSNGNGSSSIFDFLEETLASLGLMSGGLRESEDGLFFRLREGRNLMAELMELYGGRINPTPAEEAFQNDAADEVAATDVAEDTVVTAEAV